MTLDTKGEVIERNILVRGVWEKENSDFLLYLISLGERFIDIGANIGWYTCLVASCEKINVVAIEPLKRNFYYLQKNISNNNFENVTLINKGLGIKQGILSININQGDYGQTSILKNGTNKNNITENVQIEQGDDIFDSYTSIDLIKMDIEGYEFEALQGMEKTLKNNKNIKLFFEYSPIFYDKRDDKTSIAILLFLRNLGFNFYYLDKNTVLLPLGSDNEIYTMVMQEYSGQLDILASRDSIEYDGRVQHVRK